MELRCTAGLDGRFKNLNPAWEQTFGFTRAELLAQPWIELIHPDDRPKTSSAIESLGDARESVDFENRFKHKDGSYRWLSWSVTLMPEIQGYHARVTDITDRRKEEKTIAKWKPDVPPAEGGSALAQGGSETVLIAEDNAVVREALARMLAARGYNVLQASDGKEALFLCEHYPDAIHVVVTDIVMPEIGGGELAATLAKRRANTRVLYMSGFTYETPVVKRALASPSAFLRKPFEPIELLAKIRDLLETPG